MQTSIRYACTAAMLLVLTTTGCRKAEPPPVINEVVMTKAESLPGDPSGEAWNAAPEYVADLILQDLVDPRLMEPSTTELRVRALTDGRNVAFRLEWNDGTQNEMVTPDEFADACAVQLPAKVAPTVPAPQMGEPGRPVEITFWSAAWQATLENPRDSINDIYPNAAIDHYPFQAASLEPGSKEQKAMAERYAPAEALDNFMAGPRETPVQDLVAEGPGTIEPSPSANSDGRGQRNEKGWAVVLSRPLPDGIDPDGKTQVAFAVWQGARQEAGSRKMRTGWIPLTRQANPRP